jgi:hypothetical protein
MRPLRLTLLLGVLAAAVAAASAFAAAPTTSAPPVAHAAGGDVTVTLLPAIVNTRLVRTQKLLESAAQYQDLHDDANAVKALAAARSNLAKTWSGAKFYIKNAPPPVAGEAGLKVPLKVKAGAHASGGAIAGASPYADMYATTAAVLTLDHTVATTALGLLDTASATVLPALNSTVFAALNSRDAAVAYVHSLPVPPAGEAGIKVPAHASGTPVVAGWSTTMQPVLFDTDDELMQIDGLRASAAISASRTRLLDLAEAQVTKTARNINRFWPPLPADG